MIRTITRLDEIYSRLVNPKNETVNKLLDMVEGWVGAANCDRRSDACSAQKNIDRYTKAA
jgi:O-acetylhomoserine/O-acetylserine sulfhydrylase-like pyridoxal-dependent enzyme